MCTHVSAVRARAKLGVLLFPWSGLGLCLCLRSHVSLFPCGVQSTASPQPSAHSFARSRAELWDLTSPQGSSHSFAHSQGDAWGLASPQGSSHSLHSQKDAAAAAAGGAGAGCRPAGPASSSRLYPKAAAVAQVVKSGPARLLPPQPSQSNPGGDGSDGSEGSPAAWRLRQLLAGEPGRLESSGSGDSRTRGGRGANLLQAGSAAARQASSFSMPAQSQSSAGSLLQSISAARRTGSFSHAKLLGGASSVPCSLSGLRGSGGPVAQAQAQERRVEAAVPASVEAHKKVRGSTF